MKHDLMVFMLGVMCVPMVVFIVVLAMTSTLPVSAYEAKCMTEGYVFVGGKCYIPHTVPYIPEEAL